MAEDEIFRLWEIREPTMRDECLGDASWQRDGPNRVTTFRTGVLATRVAPADAYNSYLKIHIDPAQSLKLASSQARHCGG